MNYNKRLQGLMLMITAIFLFISARLFYVQIIESDDLIQQVTRQRAIDTTLKMIRGNIYDRNMIPFTDREDKLYIIVIPNLLEEFTEVSKTLSEFTGYSPEKIQETLEQKKPVTFIIDHYSEKDVMEKINHPAIKVISLSKRYSNQSLARHIIGYINPVDQEGYSGIEKAFNQYLAVGRPQSIGMIGDAFKRSIPGLGYRVVNAFGNSEDMGVKLTLDYHIQDIVEDIIDPQMESGAVVVTEVKTGNIVALASRPNYLQYDIEKHIQSQGDELLNKAFSAYDAGSVFKIVVAAAALEEKAVDLETPFTCTGHIEVDGRIIACHKEEGHGDQSFLQGFANSCNPVFIDVGLKLGYNAIINMAKRFGFGKAIPLFDGIQQNSGNVPEKKYVSPGDTANISIGQGEILVTPLQVVDMVTTIANKGIRKKLNIVDSVVSDTGNVIKQIRHEEDVRVVDTDIAESIQRMMEQVTISGTGINANLDQYGGSAGKTGSAETGWVEEGKSKVHAWFVGYFPVNDPKYAMVVFVEDGRQGGKAAVPIFREAAERILQLNY
ncbi:penicillin-binding protein 2 [Petroclostridium sp. X23]|uniref:peptidoglycan D,D-transpeptidase FtsI family protein n=1 Tax=Petroclostridium sp. X23 TaxID=3045146 RepID=UPI0024AD0F7B|nr:penicillin-binding protein 2 [Petroclostridium sp. X23]WHH60209.1 penicillin-binding protein 2 [Petroclostridium sp. X23]